MNKKYKVRKRDGWWFVSGHVGGGHYIQLSGRLSSFLTALAVINLREQQVKKGAIVPAYYLAGDEHYPFEPIG